MQQTQLKLSNIDDFCTSRTRARFSRRSPRMDIYPGRAHIQISAKDRATN